MNIFHERKIVIATMHKKELVIAPLLEHHFKANCVVPILLNTDKLGTFSGEIERAEDPLATARKKCNLAMDEMNCDLAIASEGSFGPHPASFIFSADDEIVLLVDRKNKIELIGRALSTTTNFDGKYVNSTEDAFAFAERILFPSHGLILKDKKENPELLYKGIVDQTDLSHKAQTILSEHGRLWMETDMRAQFNPTRLTVIEKATEDLISKMESLCPKCDFPGYSISDKLPGLPCDLCGRATRSTLANCFSCLQCNFTDEVLFPNGKHVEDPMYCDFCNP